MGTFEKYAFGTFRRLISIVHEMGGQGTGGTEWFSKSKISIKDGHLNLRDSNWPKGYFREKGVFTEAQRDLFWEQSKFLSLFLT